MFEEEVEGWVEEEIQRELADITLEDLEVEVEEEEEDSCHGNSQSPSLHSISVHDASPVPLDMTSLFTQYLSTLQATQTNSTELLTDAQQVLAQANLYLASTTPSNSTPTNQLHANGNEMAGSGNETHGNVTKARNGEETNQDFGDSSFSDVFNTSVREEAQSNLKGVHSQRDAEKPQEVVSTNEHQEVWSREQEEAGSYHHGSEEGMGLEELEREKQKRQEALDAMIAERQKWKREHDAALAARVEKEAAQAHSVAVTTLQAAVRGWLARKLHASRLKAFREEQEKRRTCLIVVLQAYARGWLVRQACTCALSELTAKRTKFRRTVVLLQAHARGYLVRMQYCERLQELESKRKREGEKMEGVATALQANCRGYLVRKENRPKLARLSHKRKAKRILFETSVVRVQANCRGYLTRKARTNECRKLQKQQQQQLEEPTIHSSTNPNNGTSPDSSPSKPKLTLMRRLQSALKVLRPSATSPSPPRPLSSPSTSIPTLAATPTASNKHSNRQSDLSSSTPTLPTSSPSPHSSGRRTQGQAVFAKDRTQEQVLIAKNQTKREDPIGMEEETTVGKVTPPLHQRRAPESSHTAMCEATTSHTPESTPTAMWGATTRHTPESTPTPMWGATTRRTPESTPTAMWGATTRHTPESMPTAGSTTKPTAATTPESTPTAKCGATISERRPLRVGRASGGVEVDKRELSIELVSDLAQEEDSEMLLAAEAKALQEVVRSREEELAVAQLARERMSSIFSEEEIRNMAERQRKRASYQLELDHASSPLLPMAWLGLVEDRLIRWKANHTPRRKEHHADDKQSSENVSKAVPGTCPLSKAQMLAASQKGTILEQVVQVVVYRSRKPVDLNCLQQCPKLRTATLVKCGLETLARLQETAAPILVELNVPSNEMKQLAFGSHSNLCFLDVGDNHLASLQGLGHTPQLLHLSVTGNRVARIAGVKGCPQLQRLTLDSNLLINSKGLEELSDLEYLSCCENHLPVLEGLANCHLLQHLLLAQNNLQQVPKLSSQVLLRELSLAENSLSDVSPITEAWLPLLQTLSLANNCISQLPSFACLIMLQNLDLTLNSIYDLPVLLQSLRGCYRLRWLALAGNPVTQEKQFRAYLLKAMPFLEEVEVGAGANEFETRRRLGLGGVRKKADLPEAITSSNIYVTCLHQIEEQDQLKEEQRQQLETLLEESATGCPDTTVDMLQCRVSHCHQYHTLLCQHLREQEQLEAGKWSSKMHQQGSCLAPASRPGQHMVSGEGDALVRAAVIVQAMWRGLCGRKRAASTREKRTRAAITIQAWFRGWSLRRRLYQLLHINKGGAIAKVCRNRLQVGVAQLQEEDEFNYEEEIVLDFLDEGMLEVGPTPLSPRTCSAGRVNSDQFGEAAMYFSLPGAPADTQISYQEWRDAYHAHHQRTRVATPPYRAESGELGCQTLSAEKGCVPVAWESSNQTDVSVDYHRHQHVPQQLERGQQGVGLNQGEGTSETQQQTMKPEVENEGAQLTKKETIRNEWGFTSDKTARLMWRRTQRQKHFHNSAARRRKLADPTMRFTQFKRQQKLSLDRSLPLEQGLPLDAVPRKQQSTAQSLGESSSKVAPSPSLEELSAKEHSLYKWTHNRKWVGHMHIAKPVDPGVCDYTHSSLLPHLEPHVLAGHLPRLVSSDAQNHIVGGNKSSGHTHYADSPSNSRT